jgi:hypothetical protein
LRKSKLLGACHSVTAVAHVLLREQRIESVPCIGLVLLPHAGRLVHSWLEISSLVYDLAIAFPLIEYEEFREAPVVAGRNLDTGLPTELLYGTRLTDDAISYPENIHHSSLTAYLDGSAEQGIDLWATTLALGTRLGLDVDVETLRRRHQKTPWSVREASPLDDFDPDTFFSTDANLSSIFDDGGGDWETALIDKGDTDAWPMY